VKCRVLKRGKCILSRCHVVTLRELQVDWINVGVVYIWKSTQVTNNHVREFRSMLLPNRASCSNLIALVELVMPIWNPIAPFLSFGLLSSQVAKAWRYTRPSPSPWKVCAHGKDIKGPNTFWFSNCVCRKPNSFFLPCNWLTRALIIQYVKNL
jgi:hypothetical protein